MKLCTQVHKRVENATENCYNQRVVGRLKSLKLRSFWAKSWPCARATRAKLKILRLSVSLAVLAHRGGLALCRAEDKPDI